MAKASIGSVLLASTLLGCTVVLPSPEGDDKASPRSEAKSAEPPRESVQIQQPDTSAADSAGQGNSGESTAGQVLTRESQATGAPMPVPYTPTKGQAFLPYRHPIPPNQAITVPPPPYDPKQHGDLLPNTQPPESPLSRVPVHPKGKILKDVVPTVFAGSGDRGFQFTTGDAVYGGYDVQSDFSLPDSAIGSTIYAATNMPNGNSCIEDVGARFRYTGMSNTLNYHGYWNHCGGEANFWENMDSTWQGKYARTYDGELAYFSEVYKDGSGCWRGVLYNFNTGLWEDKFTKCGSSSIGNGWSMWESHYMMDVAQVCPNLPRIRARGVRIRVSGSWTLLSTSNSTDYGPFGLCFTNGTYGFQVINANYDWQALTP